MGRKVGIWKDGVVMLIMMLTRLQGRRAKRCEQQLRIGVAARAVVLGA